MDTGFIKADALRCIWMLLFARHARYFAVPLFVLLTGCANLASKLPNYGKVPDFNMIDSNGHVFSRKMLAGSVWIIDFIYTSCPAECPRMTSKMHRIAEQVQGQDNLGLLSISVDPQRDTPSVLSRFAQRYGGATPQWHFLTGSSSTVHLLAYTTFHVGDIIGKMDHGTYFILVDKKGNIRGYYSSFDPDIMKSVLKDANVLRNARS
jgi:protein SCO1/2